MFPVAGAGHSDWGDNAPRLLRLPTMLPNPNVRRCKNTSRNTPSDQSAHKKNDALGNDMNPLRHFQETSTFVIGLSILIYDSDTDFIRINNQFTCIDTGGFAGCKTTDWIWVGISALDPDHAVDWPYHYTLV